MRGGGKVPLVPFLRMILSWPRKENTLLLTLNKALTGSLMKSSILNISVTALDDQMPQILCLCL